MGERGLYRWRTMSPRERAAILHERRANRRPWHSPPHFTGESNRYLVSAACYEHRPVIGWSPDRMAGFENDLLAVCRESDEQTFAWTVLPNHYHLLVGTPDLAGVLHRLGQLHGRTSYAWNGEEHCRGRKVWFNAAETAMKSERHFWASFLYVLNNAVKHGYVERWQDWPYGNAAEFLESVGREEAMRLWREYPIDEYGATWDPPEL